MTAPLDSAIPANPDRAEEGTGNENEGRGERNGDDQGEAYVSAGAGTDLIPGLYEGGLKTWEGGVDLVQVLSGVGGGVDPRREGASGGRGDVGEWVRGRGVIEVSLILVDSSDGFWSVVIG